MHEASIAQSILDIAIEECYRKGYERIERMIIRLQATGKDVKKHFRGSFKNL